MTIPEFMNRLTELKSTHAWRIGDLSGAVRCNINGVPTCPINAVAGYDGYGSTFKAGQKLGLQKHLYTIMACADCKHYSSTDNIREQMLDALGLREI